MQVTLATGPVLIRAGAAHGGRGKFTGSDIVEMS
jgi:hypothetical protein